MTDRLRTADPTTFTCGSRGIVERTSNVTALTVCFPDSEGNEEADARAGMLWTVLGACVLQERYALQ